MNRNGYIYVLLILNSFKGEKEFCDTQFSGILDKTIMIFLPQNFTSTHKPCNMGEISFLRVGYNFSFIDIFRVIFDEDGGYEHN